MSEWTIIKNYRNTSEGVKIRFTENITGEPPHAKTCIKTVVIIPRELVEKMEWNVSDVMELSVNSHNPRILRIRKSPDNKGFVLQGKNLKNQAQILFKWPKKEVIGDSDIARAIKPECSESEDSLIITF